MKGTDRLLAIFVVAAIALVAVSFVLVARQPTADYAPDDTAEGVVTNYLLAVSRQDYARAFGYLSPSLAGRPETAEAFVDQMADSPWLVESGEATVFRTEPASITGDRAVVRVTASRFTGGGLFDSGEWSEDFTMRLAAEAPGWRLVGGQRYWDQCWENPSPQYCRDRLPPSPEIDAVAP